MTIKTNDLIAAGALLTFAGICVYALHEAFKQNKEEAERTSTYEKEVKPLIEAHEKEIEKSIDEASMDNNYIPDPETKVKARLVLASYKKAIIDAKTLTDLEYAKSAFKIVHAHLMQGDADTWVEYYYTVYKQNLEREQIESERKFKERQISLNGESFKGAIKEIGVWILPEIRKIIRGGW